MKKKLSLLLIILCSFTLQARAPKVNIEDLKPRIDDNHFPVVRIPGNPVAEDKINMLLQLENLEHLPGVFKTHAFENVVGNEDNPIPIVHFYEYQRNAAPSNILSLVLVGESTGAYSEGFESYYNFDLRTGNKIVYNDFIAEDKIPELTKRLNTKVKNTINQHLKQLFSPSSFDQLSKEDKEFYKEQAMIYEDCLSGIDENTLEYYDFSFKKDSITFIRGRCSNHAMRAMDDLDRFYLTYAFKDIKEYLSEDGKNLISGSVNFPLSKSPDARFYKGKIGKYPITAFISKIYSDGSLNMMYWYDQHKTPIKWGG